MGTVPDRKFKSIVQLGFRLSSCAKQLRFLVQRFGLTAGLYERNQTEAMSHLPIQALCVCSFISFEGYCWLTAASLQPD